MSKFLSAAEVEDAINHIRVFADNEIGTEVWMRAQEKVVSLSKQVSLENMKFNEGRIIQPLARLDKVQVLAKELRSAQKWRIETFWRPYIRTVYLKMSSARRVRYDIAQSQHPERLYQFGPDDVDLPVGQPTDDVANAMLLYENAVLKLLNAAVLHRFVYLVFKDENREMTRYILDAVKQLHILAEVRLIQHDFEIDHYGIEYVGVRRMCFRLMAENGMLCLSILRSMLENADLLHPNAYTLLVESNRTPLLLCLVLHFKPWQRYTSRADEVFNGQTWITFRRNVHRYLSLAEREAWLALTHCLCKPNISAKFEMTPDLRNHLGLIKGRITVYIRSQMASLRSLKTFLDSANIEDTNFTPSTRLQMPEALTIDNLGDQWNPAMNVWYATTAGSSNLS